VSARISCPGAAACGRRALNEPRVRMPVPGTLAAGMVGTVAVGALPLTDYDLDPTTGPDTCATPQPDGDGFGLVSSPTAAHPQ